MPDSLPHDITVIFVVLAVFIGEPGCSDVKGDEGQGDRQVQKQNPSVWGLFVQTNEHFVSEGHSAVQASYLSATIQNSRNYTRPHEVENQGTHQRENGCQNIEDLKIF
jgi:hypothetical protein